MESVLWREPQDERIIIGADGQNSIRLLGNCNSAPIVVFNGTVLSSGTDYTIDGRQITFNFETKAGDEVYIRYVL